MIYDNVHALFTTYYAQSTSKVPQKYKFLVYDVTLLYSSHSTATLKTGCIEA